MSANLRTIARSGPRVRQPLLYAAGAFSAGIVVGAHAWRPPLWWLTAILLFIAAAAYWMRNRPWVAQALALAGWFWLGGFCVQLRTPPALPDISQFSNGEEVLLTAHVIREGNNREAGFGGIRQTLDVETEQVTVDDQAENISFGVRLNIYAKPVKGEEGDSAKALPLFRYGQRLRFPAKLRPPRNYRNDGAFDSQAWLAEEGIAALGSAKAAEVEMLPGFSGSRWKFWRARAHKSVIEKVHALWPPQQAALMDAIAVGEDAFIHRDTRVDFQRSGTYHILVVSGMNLSILALVVFWALRLLRASDLLAGLITVALSVGYAVLTDVGAPVWRAVLMLAVCLGARLVYRERSMLNAVGGAALGLLIVDPRALFGASFQMTFLSVIIIGGIGLPLLERTSEPYRRGLRYMSSPGYDISLPPRIAQFRLDLRMIAGRLARFIGGRVALTGIELCCRVTFAAYDLLAISALMQLGLALPLAWYFHRATIMGLPANVLAVPLTEVLMPAAALAVGLGYVYLPLAKIPALFAGGALEGITGAVGWADAFRIADLRVATPALATVLLAGLAIAIAMTTARRRVVVTAAGLLGLVCSAFWITRVPPKPQVQAGVLEVTAIDVGQADSTLLVTPNGRTLLVDAGGPVGGVRSEFDTGEDVVSPYLWSRGISQLDAVMLTHGHSDHLGGMYAVLANFHPRELWIGPNPATAAFVRLLKEAKQEKVEVLRRAAGDKFEFGGVWVEVFSPPGDWEVGAQPGNDDSLVARFSYGQSAVLIEGDAEKKIEREVAEQNPRAELLKVAHNGSLTSTTPELLAAVQPRMAVISVGAHNSFGHPRAEILERLANAGVAVYRTDLDGASTFYLDGRGVRARH